jgi:hypothetical protein
MAAAVAPNETVGNTIFTPLVANIDHPVLMRLGKASIRKFLIDRDAYVWEIEERSAQDNGRIGRLVSLKFSIDPQVLESLMDLRQFGADIILVALVTDDLLRSWLEKHREIRKDRLPASQVQAIITKSLRINMLEGYHEQRMIMLLSDYESLLRLHGMGWLVTDNTKVAVAHITDALKPSILSKRVEDDLNFGHAHLKRTFCFSCNTV